MEHSAAPVCKKEPCTPALQVRHESGFAMEKQASATVCNRLQECRGADSNRRPPGYESSALTS